MCRKIVTYKSSESDTKKHTVKIPFEATNIVANGAYLEYDMPIGSFGCRTASLQLGCKDKSIVILEVGTIENNL
jgi:hypothetical protein